MWRGGDNEITRIVVVEGEEHIEFIPTDSPLFRDFRCFSSSDTEILIREALYKK